MYSFVGDHSGAEKVTLEVLLAHQDTGLLSGGHRVVVDLIRSENPNTPLWTQHLKINFSIRVERLWC